MRTRFIYQAKQLGHSSTQVAPQIPPKVSHQPALPPKIPINREVNQHVPELPPKIKLQEDPVRTGGPTTDGKRVKKIK